MNARERRASETSRPRLSAARASERTSGREASAAPLKSPAIPGNTAHSRQKPPLIARAIQPFDLKSEAASEERTMRSSTRKPSTGRVNCSTTRAIETVLNLL